MTKDIHIFYSGGSGGHICSHLILESQKHYCKFVELNAPMSTTDFQKQFEYVKQRQWTIDNPEYWKSNEFWPDNLYTENMHLNDANKLFLTCGLDSSTFPDKKRFNILLYTDIDTQIEISAFKKCFLFLNRNDLYQSCNKEWKNSYLNVKEDHWPDLDLCDIDTLPTHVADELKNVHHGFDLFFQWQEHKDSELTFKRMYLSNEPTGIINNHIVLKNVADFLPKVNLAVRLQDLVKTHGKCLLDAVDLPYHSGHNELITKWLSLHSKELQRILLT